MTFLLFALAALAPVSVAFGLILWRRFVGGEQAAGGLAGSVATGLAAGVLVGAAVGLTLIALVAGIVRVSGH